MSKNSFWNFLPMLRIINYHRAFQSLYRQHATKIHTKFLLGMLAWALVIGQLCFIPMLADHRGPLTVFASYSLLLSTCTLIAVSQYLNGSKSQNEEVWFNCTFDIIQFSIAGAPLPCHWLLPLLHLRLGAHALTHWILEVGSIILCPLNLLLCSIFHSFWKYNGCEPCEKICKNQLMITNFWTCTYSIYSVFLPFSYFLKIFLTIMTRLPNVRSFNMKYLIKFFKIILGTNFSSIGKFETMVLELPYNICMLCKKHF